jgi:hypothetical protein
MFLREGKQGVGVSRESEIFLHVMDRFSAQRIVLLGADVQYRSNASELTEVGVPTKVLTHHSSKAGLDEHLL